MTVAAALRLRLQPSASDRAFRGVVADAESDVRELTRRLVNGDLSPAEWQDAMLETVAHAHAEAGYRGRLRAGDTAPFDADDTRFGQLMAHEEQPYLWRFRADIERGRYGVPGDVDRDAIERRALMYTSRLYGTANEALALVDGGEIWWRLGEADHCRSCVRLAEASPYPPGALNVYPRDGSTECLMGCKCRIETASGLSGFVP